MFDWKNSVMYKIIMGKSPIEPDINKNIGYNALKSIEIVPDGIDPETTSGEKFTVFGNLDRPGMSESGLGVNTGIGYDARLATSRWWSAAWKASAKEHRKSVLYWIRVSQKYISRMEAAEKQVAELEEMLSDRTQDVEFEYANAKGAEQRVVELEEALSLLLDGLDSNYDERCGLTGKEWEQRIFDAGLVLNKV